VPVGLLGQDTLVVFVRAKNGQKERISIKKYLNIKCAAIVSKVPNRKSTLQLRQRWTGGASCRSN